MFRVEGYEWIIYFLSLLSVMMLGTLSGTSLKNKFAGKIVLVKKICLGVFIITSIYWIITFPSVSPYFNFADKSDYPAEISLENQSKYIKEHHGRIESLERELKETKDELKKVTERIDLILQIIMYALIYFGASWIFSSNKKDSEENGDNLNL